MWRAGPLIGLGLVSLAALGTVPAPGRADIVPGPRTPGDVSPLPVLGPAPEFRLRSLEGPGVRLRDLRGKLALLAFTCASCADEPEDVAAGFVRLQGALKARRLFGRKVALVFVVRHPERETRAGFRAYALRLGADPFGWLILSGSPETTRDLLERFGRFGGPAGAAPPDLRGRVFLVDYAGRVRRVYRAGALQVEQVLADMERLR